MCLFGLFWFLKKRNQNTKTTSAPKRRKLSRQNASQDQFLSGISSSSSCRAASTDIPDPLLPLLPIVHRLWQVFRAIPSNSCSIYVRAGRPAFARPYVGVHRSRSLMSSSLLLQQCPAYQTCRTLLEKWLELSLLSTRQFSVSMFYSI